MVEFLDPIVWVIKNRPELLGILIPIVWALSERSERKAQHEVNKELTDKLLTLTEGMHGEQKETNVLLQILVGRKKL